MTKIFVLVSLIGLWVGLTLVKATDYVFVMSEGGALPCPGKENSFFPNVLDLSKIELQQIDDINLLLNGKVTTLVDFTPNCHVVFRVDVERMNNGRWIKTAFSIIRNDFCKSLFDKNEIWYEFLKDLQQGEARKCPPKLGTIVEFNNKSVSTDVNELAPGMEGVYRIIINMSMDSADSFFCAIFEGDIDRKGMGI